MRKTAGAVGLLMATWLMLGCVSLASTITGTVTNLSRHKPSCGDDVVLYRVDKSMHEVMRANTDLHGRFQLEGPTGAQYLVAVIHDRISYHTALLMGSEPATVIVYDAVSRLAAVLESSSTLYPVRDGRWLKITQFFVVSNVSVPARTLTTPFSFELPKGAMLDSAAVEPPGTLPFRVKVSACGELDQYCVPSPIRPGVTRIRVIYHFDFPREISVALPLPRSVNQVLVKIPESLHLQANGQATFRNDGQRNGLSTYSVDGLHQRRTISFSLSPVTPEATDANREMTTPRPVLWPRDADYERKSQPLKAGEPITASSPSGSASSELIVFLGVLMSALFGARVVFASLCRSSVRAQFQETSLSRKAQ
jgi:hypothetical protein